MKKATIKGTSSTLFPNVDSLGQSYASFSFMIILLTIEKKTVVILLLVKRHCTTSYPVMDKSNQEQGVYSAITAWWTVVARCYYPTFTVIMGYIGDIFIKPHGRKTYHINLWLR